MNRRGRRQSLHEVEQSPDRRYIRFDERLGSGAYKDVYLCYDTETGQECAWNTVYLGGLPAEEQDRIRGETLILQSLSHPHIMGFHQTWENPEKQEICFTTEIVTSGTLKQYISRVKAIKLKVIKNWCKQILDALTYLHSLNPPIVHRDLKCDNIFIHGSTGSIRLGDFGLARAMHRTHVESVLGTPEFMAPELYEQDYTESVDIYAFGMCVLEMVSKEYPWEECTNAAQIWKKVSKGERPGVLNRIKNEEVRRFIEICLAQPEYRLSAKQLQMHPFLAFERSHPHQDDLVVEVTPRTIGDGHSNRPVPDVASTPTAVSSRKSSVERAGGETRENTLNKAPMQRSMSTDIIQPLPLIPSGVAQPYANLTVQTSSSTVTPITTPHHANPIGSPIAGHTNVAPTQHGHAPIRQPSITQAPGTQPNTRPSAHLPSTPSYYSQSPSPQQQPQPQPPAPLRVSPHQNAGSSHPNTAQSLSSPTSHQPLSSPPANAHPSDVTSIVVDVESVTGSVAHVVLQIIFDPISKPEMVRALKLPEPKRTEILIAHAMEGNIERFRRQYFETFRHTPPSADTANAAPTNHGVAGAVPTEHHVATPATLGTPTTVHPAAYHPPSHPLTNLNPITHPAANVPNATFVRPHPHPIQPTQHHHDAHTIPHHATSHSHYPISRSSSLSSHPQSPPATSIHSRSTSITNASTGQRVPPPLHHANSHSQLPSQTGAIAPPRRPSTPVSAVATPVVAPPPATTNAPPSQPQHSHRPSHAATMTVADLTSTHSPSRSEVPVGATANALSAGSNIHRSKSPNPPFHPATADVHAHTTDHHHAAPAPRIPHSHSQSQLAVQMPSESIVNDHDKLLAHYSTFSVSALKDRIKARGGHLNGLLEKRDLIEALITLTQGNTTPPTEISQPSSKRSSADRSEPQGSPPHTHYTRGRSGTFSGPLSNTSSTTNSPTHSPTHQPRTLQSSASLQSLSSSAMSNSGAQSISHSASASATDKTDPFSLLLSSFPINGGGAAANGSHSRSSSHDIHSHSQTLAPTATIVSSASMQSLSSSAAASAAFTKRPANASNRASVVQPIAQSPSPPDSPTSSPPISPPQPTSPHRQLSHTHSTNKSSDIDLFADLGRTEETAPPPPLPVPIQRHTSKSDNSDELHHQQTNGTFHHHD